MRTNVLLITTPSADSSAVVKDAAARTGRGLVHANNTQHAFAILEDQRAEIDLVVIDLDPGMHTLYVLEAIGNCAACPPVIVLTSLEQTEMEEIVQRHAGSACIGKPFTAADLASRMEHVLSVKGHKPGMTCDHWGHPAHRHGELRPRKGDPIVART